MDREPTSFNCREDHKEWMDAQNLNRSEFLNQLITDFRESGGSVDDIMTRFQLRQLEMEHEQLTKRAELVNDQMEQLEESMETQEEVERRQLVETFEKMDRIPADPDNMAVQNQAENHDMTPEEFAKELQEWRENNA